MQLTLGIDSAIASARLWALMLRIRDPARLHKLWGIRVMNPNGYYWSSSYSEEHYGYSVWLAEWILRPEYDYPVYYGNSVRLVQDAE